MIVDKNCSDHEWPDPGATGQWGSHAHLRITWIAGLGAAATTKVLAALEDTHVQVNTNTNIRRTRAFPK